MKTLASLLLACSFLAGCSTLKPAMPEGYTGPKAFIVDSVVPESGTKGQIFFVRAIDGNPIESAEIETRRMTAGRGMTLVLSTKFRQVPARPLRLTLVGTHATGAPIHEMASRAMGTFFSVEGEVAFTPEPDGDYIVQGELKKEGSSVWLADAKTLKPVSAVVTEKK